CAGGGAHQPREPGQRRAGAGETGARRRGHAPVSRQGAERSQRHCAAARRESEQRRCLPPIGQLARAEAPIDDARGPRSVGDDFDLRQAADATATVRTRHRVRDPRSLQPQQRSAIGADRLQCRARHAGCRISERCIDPPRLGWYSGDHHIHAAGCSHYQNPTEGVLPEDMMRQILGEALNIGSVLTWGPCYYYQKQFFTGQDNPLSKPDRVMHYDLEVSGFPSSHAGHLVLLGRKDQDYPKTHRIEDWPSWDLPILTWAKSQGAVVGFAHSGFGLQVQDRELPSYEMPPFDGIGANEYIVDVTHPNSVDFMSTVNT